MRVSVHDLLHCALGEEGAQLAPQALPLLTGWTFSLATHPGTRGAALPPMVAVHSVGLSDGGLCEVRLV